MTKVFRGGFFWFRSDNRKSKIENLKSVGFLFLCVTLAMCGAAAQAQQPKKVPRVGFLAGSGDPNTPGPQVEAFRRGLRDLGYVEGKNILVEYLYIAGTSDRTPSLV